jgi:protein-disulfide isomerase
MARNRTEKKRKETNTESPPPSGVGMKGPIVGFIFGFAIATALWKYGPLAVPAVAPASLVAVDIPGMPPARFVPVDGRPSRGPADAPITVVEFTDYECPFCKRHTTETYPLINANYGGEIRYVIRNFPLTSIHPHAQKAAEAAECAFDQGLFWEYHDKLFAESPDLQVDRLKQYAGEVGLDQAAFSQCLDSGQKRQLVEADFQDAVALGLRGTPGFFVNGRALYGAQPLRMFEAYFQALSE